MNIKADVKAPTQNEMRVRKDYRETEEILWLSNNAVDFFSALYTLMMTPQYRVYKAVKFDEASGAPIEFKWRVNRKDVRKMFSFAPDLLMRIEEQLPEVHNFLQENVAHQPHVLAFENATLVLNYAQVADPQGNLPHPMSYHKELIVRIAGISRYLSTVKEGN